MLLNERLLVSIQVVSLLVRSGLVRMRVVFSTNHGFTDLVVFGIVEVRHHEVVIVTIGELRVLSLHFHVDEVKLSLAVKLHSIFIVKPVCVGCVLVKYSSEGHSVGVLLHII